MNDARLH